MPQFKATGSGPGTSSTSMSNDSGAKSQDAAQGRAMGIAKPSETNGAGLSSSPSMNISGDDYQSSNMNTSVGSGSRPTKSTYPIGTSAPTDVRTQGRAPGGWLK